jgi:hypothetical protein
MGRSPSHKKQAVAAPKWAKELDNFNKKTKYPHCKGTFPDCPTEIKPEVVEQNCRTCPIYKKSNQ